jgi:hypothetical protein
MDVFLPRHFICLNVNSGEKTADFVGNMLIR